MTRFAYHAADDTGAVVQGDVDAATLADASAQLRARGILVFSLSPAEPPPDAAPLKDLDAFTMFNRGLGDMLRSGIALPEGIREIASGLGRGRFRAGLERTEARLREGRPLHEA